MTTEYDLLLRGVLIDPRANLPRLVLTDYLEENGHDRRAKLIRKDIGGELGPVSGSVLDAMLDFGEGRFAQAVEAIVPLRYDVWRIGGSHAQRDVVDLTLIAAAERAGESNLARALLAERAALRPTPRWLGRLAQARAALAP